VDTGLRAAAATEDLRQARLRVVPADQEVMADRPVDTVALPVAARHPADTADLRKGRLPVDMAAADSDNRPEVMAADSAAADLVRPAVASRLPEDPWVREWATTSTPRCR
jgi:hypothetical protein